MGIKIHTFLNLVLDADGD